MPTRFPRKAVFLGLASSALLVAAAVQGSSHREAPFITKLPKVDGTDFYMFRSYESGREGYVTLIANYLPLQDAYGGPNYFDLDEDAIYEIHIDNDGNAVEDITFRFDFDTVFNDLTVPAGDQDTSVPVKNIGGIGPNPGDTDNVQVRQTYTVDVIRGDRRSGDSQSVVNLSGGSESFRKPLDNIGDKSFGGDGNYASYANAHIYDVTIPGCNDSGRVFVGQREEGFAINLGEIFDLVNLDNPVGDPAGEINVLDDKNITSLAMEVPIACLTAAGEPVIGGWTTASLRQARVLNPEPASASEDDGFGASVSGGAFTQVSRLGAPLVNEVVIGLKDKDRFNASEPMNDGQFLDYVTNPSLPELLQILFPDAVTAPNTFPRSDLVSAFLTGVEGLNQPGNVTPSEMLRLNTGIEPVAADAQNNLGVLGEDTAGFPNGRRPGDDVTDIELRVAVGALLPDAPSGGLALTDGATHDAGDFQTAFPYLNTPLPGSPNDSDN